MFNTLMYAKRLEAVGVPRDQAETHMQIMVEIAETNFATKNDIQELKHELQKMEYRLIIKVGALNATLLALAATCLTIMKSLG